MIALNKARVLLLQARHADDPAKQEEQESFAKRSGLDVSQFTSHDLLTGPPAISAVGEYDAVMVGGAGDFYVSRRDLPAHDEIVAFLGELSQSAQPLFASCFGFQFLVEALGGTIVFDPDNTEVGTCEMTLTKAGHEDELFGHLPAHFLAQMGRKDRAQADFTNFPTLARSAAAPVQAIRVPGKPVWASQFHPELDRETNLGRYTRYLDGYKSVMTKEQIETALASFQESPHTMDLLRRFLTLVLA